MTDHAACIIWPRARDSHGRGQVFRNGKRMQVHRLVCEQAHGAPPTLDHQAAHLCENGRGGCVNPEHLRWMTRAENNAMRTDTRRGRVLSEEDVRDIRAWKTLVYSTKWVADRYGIDPSTVRQIMSGRRWWWLS
jgi:hypothetical protein